MLLTHAGYCRVSSLASLQLRYQTLEVHKDCGGVLFVQAYTNAAPLSEEEAHNLATHVLPPSFLVVHDAIRGGPRDTQAQRIVDKAKPKLREAPSTKVLGLGQHKVTKLTGWKKITSKLLNAGD